MDQSKQINSDEINLRPILISLWNAKLIIIVFSFISALIGFYLNYNNSSTYEVSSPIGYGKSSTFIDFITINDVLKKSDLYLSDLNPNGYKIDSLSIFDMFLTEFYDYEEMMLVLQKDDVIKQSTKDLDTDGKKQFLINSAKNFEISRNGKERIIFFTWDNIENGKQLMNDALILTLDNVKSNVINDLEKLAKSIDLKNNRELDFFQIKLELVEEKLITFSSLLEEEQLKVATEYFELREKILLLEKDISVSVLQSSLKVIKNSNPNDWVSFDLALADSRSDDYSILQTLAVFAIFGFIIGSVYILILNSIRKI